MKTIIILVDQLYMHGGIEKLVAIKANYWSENFGYKVIIVSTEQQENKPIYKLSEKVKFIDINIDYDRLASFFHPKNFSKIRANMKELKLIFKNNSPDFILVASHIPMTYVLPFLKLKAKIIKEFHYSKFAVNRNLKEFLFSRIEKFYDYLVVLSAEEQSFYKSKNTVLIPNPIISPQAHPININEKPKILGAILRFAPVKQVEKMVEIWEEFYKNNIDWKFFIYGATDNDYFEKVKKLVHDKGLEDSIIFKGENNNIIEALFGIKILIMTSLQECFPMVILEANSCGVPVISFDSPTGPRNIIRNNINGIIVPLNDVGTFVVELNNLIKNKQKLLAMSENSIKIAEQFQLEKVMKIWQQQIFEKK